MKCLDVFAKELNGFDPKRAIFNFPYNASTPELEAWLPTEVRAFRAGRGALNPLPHKGQVKLHPMGFGPDNCEAAIDREVANEHDLRVAFSPLDFAGHEDDLVPVDLLYPGFVARCNGPYCLVRPSQISFSLSAGSARFMVGSNGSTALSKWPAASSATNVFAISNRMASWPSEVTAEA